MKKRIQVTGALIVALGAVSMAKAGDAKVLMGGACLPLLPPGSSYNPFVATKMYAENRHTAALTYVCMLTRDSTATTSGLANATASVTAPANQSVECTLKSVNQFHAQLDLVTKSLPASPSLQQTDLPFGAELGNTTPNGGYGLSCILPPRGRILTYRYTEN